MRPSPTQLLTCVLKDFCVGFMLISSRYWAIDNAVHIGENCFRKSQRFREFEPFLEWVFDLAKPAIVTLRDPTFQPSPGYCGNYRVIAAIEELLRTLSELFQGS